ncbi:copper resistance CopC/CopD family protein [Paracoccus actinidiae]|uniref:copper resistance CopC/CopD family protein n=1 Tax=Paracoccus actinidiae TaxID=3064531 RepID=UPI0027D22FC2|nr:CopD family protein [Paracoccus sp. M09]
MPPIIRIVLAVGAALWISLQAATMALAHAEFRGSDPVPDAMLVTLPECVTLRFSEEVGVLALSWLLPDGTEESAEADARSGILHITPPPKSGQGSYTLKWRVASADGHPIGGALVFSLGHASGHQQQGDVHRASYLAVAFRAAMVMALALCIGSALYKELVGPVPQTASAFLGKAAYAVPVFGLFLIGSEGADRLGGLDVLLTLDGWRQGFMSPSAHAVLLSILAAALVALHARHKHPLYAFSAWVIASASFAVAGHALSEPWPLMPLTFLHGAAALFWVGGLVPLTSAVLAADGQARAVPLRQFSKVALPIVGVLIVTGAALIVHRADVPDVLKTPWASLLAVKLSLVSVMLALAALHRYRTTSRIQAGSTTSAKHSLRAEIVIGVLVLILAMGFRLAPPPTAGAEHVPMTHLQKGTLMVMVAPSAVPPGTVSFTLHVSDASRPGVAPKEVSMSLSDPAAGIGPIEVEAEALDGQWQTQPATLPTAGPWEAIITVLVSDFEQVRLNGDIGLPD